MSSSVGRVFRDVPDEIDEAWTNGVLIGDMASSLNDLELARAYAEAAAQLVDPALESGEAWRLTYPIFYLYRHALELYLKAVVRPPRPRHELPPLVEEVEKLLRERLHTAIPTHLKDDLLVFATVNPDAQSFRYSYTTTGKRRLLPGEYWVRLRDLRRFADEVFRFIEDALRRLPR
ncbi:MAG: hypothetical protein AB7U18_20670 [Dehalococcoidia bacterium]